MRSTAWGLGLILGLALPTLAPGCVGGGADDGCPPGAEGCTCVSPNLCAMGLSCVSGYCVNLGGGGENDDNTDGDGNGDGDGDGDGVNLCELLIDCVKEVQPEALSSYVTLYGPEGECYDIAGLTQEDCWAECDAIRDTLATANPDVAECGSYNCGDGKLNLDEMCDGTDGCTATCKYSTASVYENDCSPVTQAGCELIDSRCGLSFGDFESSFWCRDSAGQSPNAKRSEECFSDAECSAPNALCLPRPDCVSNSCCTTTCYLGPTDENFGCPAGYTCTPIPSIFGGNWPDGSELVGVCW